MVDYNNLPDEYYKEYKRLGGKLPIENFKQILNVFTFLFPDAYCYSAEDNGILRDDVCELFTHYLFLYMNTNELKNDIEDEFEFIFRAVDNVTCLS